MSKANKKEILEKMVRIRLVEQYLAKRYPEQKMKCPAHFCLGQEAVPAIFGQLAKAKDIFVGTCRSHGYYLGKGGDLTRLFAELLGSPKGCSGGFGGSMHVIDLAQGFLGTSAIVAGGVPIAAGVAYAQKYRHLPNITICFLGDAAVEEGVVYETANFAVLHKLPILFVCENNRMAVSTPIELRQANTEIYNRFESMGMRSYKIKKNDVLNLIGLAEESYRAVRSGSGPVFIEHDVSRWSVHAGHEYEGPIDAWWQDPAAEQDCPLCALINELIDNKETTLARVRALRAEVSAEIEGCFAVAERPAEFSRTALAAGVYASPLRSKLPGQSLRSGLKDFKCQEQSKLVNPF